MRLKERSRRWRVSAIGAAGAAAVLVFGAAIPAMAEHSDEDPAEVFDEMQELSPVEEPEPASEESSGDEQGSGEPDVPVLDEDDAGPSESTAPTIAPASIDTFEIRPSVISFSDIQDVGVSVTATGLDPGTDAHITINGEPSGTLRADDTGVIQETLSGHFDPGEYIISLVSDGVTMSASFTVLADAQDPVVWLDASHIPAWNLARTGLSVEAYGIAPGATVQILINGDVVDEDTADIAGALEFTFSADLAPGEYTLGLRTPDGEAAEGFTVVADDEWWDASNYEPWAGTDWWVITESQIAETPLRVEGSGFPASSAVDVLLNGVVIDTVRTQQHDGAVEYELHGPLEADSFTVVLVHAIGQVSTEFHVVPDEQGSPPAEGDYAGSSIQTHAGNVELDTREERAFSFSVDSGGNLTDLSGRYWWACSTGDSGFADFSESAFVATPITVDRPFEVYWTHDFTDYTFYGIVRSSGEASGMIHSSLSACGASILTWTASFEGDLPDPEPVEVVAEAPTRDGNVVSIPIVEGVLYVDEAAATLSGDVTLGEGQTLTVTAVAEDGYVLADGAHQWIFEYEDPSDPEPTDPEEGDLDPALEGAISAPETAEAGETIIVHFDNVEAGTEVTIWFFSEPVNLGTHTVVGGAVEVTLPADAIEGTHKIAAFEGDEQLGWTSIEITSADGTDPEPVEVVAEAPTRDGNVVSIPIVEGVLYVDEAAATLSGDVTLGEGQTLTVTAVAEDGYVLADGAHQWIFEYEGSAGPDPDPEAPEPTAPTTDNSTDESDEPTLPNTGMNGPVLILTVVAMLLVCGTVLMITNRRSGDLQ